MKISIIVVSYNQPDFIEYQFKLLNKFLKNNFEYFIYDNSNNSEIEKKTFGICNKLSINYQKVPQNIFSNNFDPSHRAGKSLDFSITENIKNHNPEKIIILDSDMFLIDFFDFDEEVNCDFKGILQHRDHVYYYTNQLVFLKMGQLEDFSYFPKFINGYVDGILTDCGGHLYYYFEKYHNVEHKNVDFSIHSQTIESFDKDKHKIIYDNKDLFEYFAKEIDFMPNKKNFSELYQNKFLHFRAGSNWINFDKKTTDFRKNNLKYFFDQILKNE